MRHRIVWLFVLFAANSADTRAHEIVAAHTCIEPNFLIDYSDENEVERFIAEVSSYSTCLQRYMESEGAQSQAHVDKMLDAMEEWGEIKSRIEEALPKEIVEKINSPDDAGES